MDYDELLKQFDYEKKELFNHFYNKYSEVFTLNYEMGLNSKKNSDILLEKLKLTDENFEVYTKSQSFMTLKFKLDSKDIDLINKYALEANKTMDYLFVKGGLYRILMIYLDCMIMKSINYYIFQLKCGESVVKEFISYNMLSNDDVYSFLLEVNEKGYELNRSQSLIELNELYFEINKIC